MSDKTKGISPSASIEKYIEETLDLEKYRKSGKKTSDGSSIGSKIQLRIRNNDDAKGRAIDNLFKSMANLIYFFEFINNHPEFIEKYGDDIEDLFGLQFNSTDPKGSPFSRLIKGIMGKGYGKGYDDSNDIRFYFRRRLLSMMQFRTNEKLKFYALRSKDARFYDMIRTDLERTDVWANYLDKYMNDGSRKPRRVLAS
jgi:hypothetical protein